jgi:hypothetical protein
VTEPAEQHRTEAPMTEPAEQHRTEAPMTDPAAQDPALPDRAAPEPDVSAADESVPAL